MNLMKKISLIILDANFLLIPIQFQIDIYDDIRNLIAGEIKIVIISAILNELSLKIEREKQSTKFKHEVKKSIEFLEQKMKEKPNLFLEMDRKRVPEILVDDLLVELGKDLMKDAKEVYIATNDKKVKENAQRNGLHTLCMHQKKYIGY